MESFLLQAFVLLYQLQVFSQGKVLPDYAPILPPVDMTENSRATAMGLDTVGPKQGVELSLGQFSPFSFSFLIYKRLIKIFH